jgi:hypothetical protein
MIVSVRE